ncbi:MAG: Zn-dependent hydrolase [bacterium]|nr:Zn-dependent hydrolase [bacterium]
MDFKISPAEIEAHYAVLNKIGNLGSSLTDGFLRAGYSTAETAAMNYFANEAGKIGLNVRRDAVGNVFIECPGQTPEFIECGSHLDTVPLGGNFDGAAGIVAGFAAIKAMLPVAPQLQRGLRLRIWRCEESATFGVVYCGSKAAFGGLDADNLNRSFDGQTLADAMLSQGADPGFITSRQAAISQTEIDNIAAHIELHIEQGNLLEVTGKDIGIVSSIRGSQRSRVELHGQFDHSGATPMGPAFRRDVNLGMAHILVQLDELASRYLSQGKDLVQTVGIINCDSGFSSASKQINQNAITKVSGYGYFTLDIRSRDNDFRSSYCDEVDKLILDVAARFGLEVAMKVISSSPAVGSLDNNIQQQLTSSAAELGYSTSSMPSGAGHDAVIVAQQRRTDNSTVPVGMIFIPCRDGKSHCPEEFSSYEAIARGASVLAQTIFKLAQ